MAVVLTAALLIVACPGETPKTDGYGYVTLNIGDTHLSRTIRPNETDVENSIESYKLTFTATDGYAKDVLTPPVELEINKGLTATLDPIPLIPGEYELEVIAYTVDKDEQDDDENAIAEGTVTVKITEGANTPTTVEITAFDPDGISTGKFSWNFNFAGLTASTFSATMTIDPDPNTLEEIDILDINNNTADPQELPSGYYDVNIVIEIRDTAWITLHTDAADAEIATFNFSQSMWIYKDLTSPFAFTFTDRSFGPQTVTFNFNDGINGEDETDPIVVPVTLGGTVALPNTYTFGDEEDFDGEKWTFVGWWTRNGVASTGTPDPVEDYNRYWGDRFFGTGDNATKVFGDIEVYGWWVESYKFDIIFKFSGTLEITIDTDDSTLTNGQKIEIANLIDEIELTVTNDGFTTIEWFNMKDLLVPIETGDTLTIDVEDDGYFRGFEYTFYVKASKASGDPESFWFVLDFLP